jgi:hypothetical protein
MASPSVVNTGTQTLIQLVTPSTRRAWIREIAVSGKDTDGAKVPSYIDLVRQTSAGSGGTGITPNPIRSGMPASLCTGCIERPTSEPSGTTIVGGPWYLTTVGGLFHLQEVLGEEIELLVSERVGLRIITPGSISGVIANMRFLE